MFQLVTGGCCFECPEIGAPGKKQAACLAGQTRQPGAWKGKALSQGGHKHLRDARLLPAFVASRLNSDLCDKYQAMINMEKPAKVAPTTIMRKRIELANALIAADRNRAPKLS